jgi:hypothetical protein
MFLRNVVDFQLTTRRHIIEDRTLHICSHNSQTGTCSRQFWILQELSPTRAAYLPYIILRPQTKCLYCCSHLTSSCLHLPAISKCRKLQGMRLQLLQTA